MTIADTYLACSTSKFRDKGSGRHIDVIQSGENERLLAGRLYPPL